MFISHDIYEIVAHGKSFDSFYDNYNQHNFLNSVKAYVKASTICRSAFAKVKSPFKISAPV